MAEKLKLALFGLHWYHNTDPVTIVRQAQSVTPRGTIDVEMARRYAELGVHRLVFLPTSMEGPAIDAMIKQVAETLIDHI